MNALTIIDGATQTVIAVDHPKREMRQSLLIGGLFFGALLGGAALVPLDSGAIASGTVAVAGNRQAVQHRDGGIVSALYVREGQTVTKGQVLVSISASEIRAAERGLTAEIFALIAQRQRLIAERDGLSKINPPFEFTNLTGDDRVIADDAMQGQIRLLDARRDVTGAQKGVLGQRSRQTREQIIGVDRQRAANREQRRLLAEEIKGMKALEAKGYASTNRIRAMERAAAGLDGEYGALSAQIARSREAIGEVSMQSLSINRTNIEEVSQQARDVSVRLDELRPKLTAARERLAQAEVRAPSSGRVVGLSVFTVGGVVSAGQMLMEIVPQDRELVISATISPRDADDIQVGQTAQVRFTAIQERNLPILKGQISRLSADSFADERTGERSFRAEIKVPETELDRIRKVRPGKTVIQAGLPAEILVPLRKRSAFAYLFEPLTRSLWLAARED
jgi:HlyD family type I secretion membrane fusion protein